MNSVYVSRLAYGVCYGSMSISLDPIADVTSRCSRPYDLEGIGMQYCRRLANFCIGLFTMRRCDH